MNLTFEAIFENGVFRPLQPVGLADKARVSVTVAALNPQVNGGLDSCAGVLSAADAAEMRRVVEEEFERVDERDW